MGNPALKKIGKRVLQIGLPLAIVAAFLYKVHVWNWHILVVNASQWNPWLLVLAFGGFILQELSFGLIWQAVLARLGFRLDLRACLRVYLASEFVRYIPGNVWHVLTRILWVGKYGVSRPIAFASMTVELITKLAAGALLFAAEFRRGDRKRWRVCTSPFYEVRQGSIASVRARSRLDQLHPKRTCPDVIGSSVSCHGRTARGVGPLSSWPV